VAEVGDAAFFSGAQDAEQSLEVRTGDRLFVVDLRRFDAGQPSAQNVLLALARTFLATLLPPSPPNVAPPPSLPPPCTPTTGGAGAGLAHHLGDSPDWSSLLLRGGPSGTPGLDSVLGNANEAAGLFNALDKSQVQSMVSQVLVSNKDHQPVYPTIWDPLKTDLESCLLSETFTHWLVTTPDARLPLNDIYRNLAGDTRASVGLMKPMTADEILAGYSFDAGVPVPDQNLQVVDNEYGRVAATALASDITSLLGEGKDFTLPVATALNYLSSQAVFDYASLAGGKGTKDLSDLTGDSVVTAANNYIDSTEPPAPPATLDFGAANQSVNVQIPLSGPTLIQAPNDIYGPSESSGVPSTAAEYYFDTWASRAATLEYTVVDQLARLQAESVLNAHMSELLKTVFCAAFEEASEALCFLWDTAGYAQSVLDNTPESQYAGSRFVARVLEAPAAHLLPALGVIFDSTNPLLSGGNPGVAKAMEKAAGEFLCNQETRTENLLVDRLDRGRLLVRGTTSYRGHIQPPKDVYDAEGGRAQVTFAYADGTDTGSAVFPMINGVQATWRTMVNGTIPPSDYEACGLGGQDPTLAQYEMPIDGSGFAPNSQVTITGHSTPTFLARTQTDVSGRFRLSIDPRQLGIGEHEILAQGRTPDGSARVLHWSVRVTRDVGGRHRDTVWVWWLTLAGALLLLVGGLAVRYKRKKST